MFTPHSDQSDVGGALRLGGVATVSGCSFTSNMASSSGLAISAVGSVEINSSTFSGNVFLCNKGRFSQDVLQVRKYVVQYVCTVIASRLVVQHACWSHVHTQGVHRLRQAIAAVIQVQQTSHRQVSWVAR